MSYSVVLSALSFFIAAIDIVVVGIVVSIVSGINSDTSLSACLIPTWFHEHTNMNKFGCWFCTLVLVPFTPFTSIYRFLYWLCHI